MIVSVVGMSSVEELDELELLEDELLDSDDIDDDELNDEVRSVIHS
jgi:hypothetical protein